jgi:hypothetical protein
MYRLSVLPSSSITVKLAHWTRSRYLWPCKATVTSEHVVTAQGTHIALGTMVSCCIPPPQQQSSSMRVLRLTVTSHTCSAVTVATATTACGSVDSVLLDCNYYKLLIALACSNEAS